MPSLCVTLCYLLASLGDSHCHFVIILICFAGYSSTAASICKFTINVPVINYVHIDHSMQVLC